MFFKEHSKLSKQELCIVEAGSTSGRKEENKNLQPNFPSISNSSEIIHDPPSRQDEEQGFIEIDKQNVLNREYHYIIRSRGMNWSNISGMTLEDEMHLDFSVLKDDDLVSLGACLIAKPNTSHLFLKVSLFNCIKGKITAVISLEGSNYSSQVQNLHLTTAYRYTSDHIISKAMLKKYITTCNGYVIGFDISRILAFLGIQYRFVQDINAQFIPKYLKLAKTQKEALNSSSVALAQAALIVYTYSNPEFTQRSLTFSSKSVFYGRRGKLKTIYNQYHAIYSEYSLIS